MAAPAFSNLEGKMLMEFEHTLHILGSPLSVIVLKRKMFLAITLERAFY